MFTSLVVTVSFFGEDMTYDEYMHSEQWRALRALAIKRAGYKCTGRDCGSPHNLEAHHIRYPIDFAFDHVDNLRVLCHECHKAEHPNRYPRRHEFDEGEHISSIITRVMLDLCGRRSA